MTLTAPLLQAAFFYLFSALAVASAAMVILARNPVHAVLFLILAFFNAAGLFVLLNAEFLAMLLIIVYVGAVAVLFLFVVMMLDVDFAELKAGFIKNAPIGLMVAGLVLAELIALFVAKPVTLGLAGKLASAAPAGVANTKALGLILYTKYAYLFQASGLVLLVAMIGAIVLTHRQRLDVKRQNISSQVNRSPKTAMSVEKVASGSYTIPPKKDAPVAPAAPAKPSKEAAE